MPSQHGKLHGIGCGLREKKGESRVGDLGADLDCTAVKFRVMIACSKVAILSIRLYYYYWYYRRTVYYVHGEKDINKLILVASTGLARGWIRER